MVHAFGLIGVFCILIAETGLLVGFFLPGDSMLFLAGVVSAGAASSLAGVHLPLAALLIGCPISAVVGAQIGYYLGVKAGHRIVKRKSRERLDRAETYFLRFGPAKSIVLSRFVGIIRTFINPAAGILGMSARRFLLWNVISAIAWTDSVVLAGYFVGHSFPVDKYLTPVIIGIVILATVPGVISFVRARPSADDENPTASDRTDSIEPEAAQPEPV